MRSFNLEHVLMFFWQFSIYCDSAQFKNSNKTEVKEFLIFWLFMSTWRSPDIYRNFLFLNIWWPRWEFLKSLCVVCLLVFTLILLINLTNNNSFCSWLGISQLIVIILFLETLLVKVRPPGLIVSFFSLIFSSTLGDFFYHPNLPLKFLFQQLSFAFTGVIFVLHWPF